MRHIISDSAKQDLREITDFIRKDDSRAARAVAREIREAIHRIAGFPNLGHPHAHIKNASLRTYGVHSYLIVYKVVANSVEIVRIVHGARDLKRIFRKT